jgi:hypothetical protein
MYGGFKVKNFKKMVYKNLYDAKVKNKEEPTEQTVKDVKETDKKEVSKDDET